MARRALPADRTFYEAMPGLLDAVPNPARHLDGGLREIPGRVPVLAESPGSCTFADRCPYADEVCRDTRPDMEPGPAGHPVR